MPDWISIPIDAKWFSNVHETVLTRAQAAVENAYINEAGGHSRFPGLMPFVSLGGGGKVYLNDWKDDLIAATSDGKLFRIDRSGSAENVTGVPIGGGKRVTFAKSEDEMMMAAGGPIIRFAGKRTEVLSEDAPDSTHVGYIDSYAVAIEPHSGRFVHAEAGDARSWNPVDVFTADSQPDALNSLIVTPFRELILCGVDSAEQFERLASGDVPFFRRWGVGEGVYAPYTLVFADNAVWALNKKREFVRFSGQVSQPSSDDLGRTMEAVDDWREAWAAPCHVSGQKFIILQAPHATNAYGTKGITVCLDYRQQKWFAIYGWDQDLGRPGRWPGWSVHDLWGRKFVGGEGKIFELVDGVHTNDGTVQRMLGRTAHLSELGEVRVDNLRARLRRGVGTYEAAPPVIRLRAVRDGENPSRWVSRNLGKAGANAMYVEFGGFGCATTWQFEWEITDDCPVELIKLEAQLTRIGR